MPVHDWTRVAQRSFTIFTTCGLQRSGTQLNQGVLPEGYYALTERHAGRIIPDILALRSRSTGAGSGLDSALWRARVGGSAPRVRRKLSIAAAPPTRRRTLAIRHVSGHRLIALIEAVSPSNKDRLDHVEEFAAKVASALALGIHVLVIDLFPPGPCEPSGMHAAVRELLEDGEESAPDDRPADEPLSLVSYVAGQPVDAYFESLALGRSLPDMPLFLQADRYINVPLEATYQAAFQGEPFYWRDILERA